LLLLHDLLSRQTFLALRTLLRRRLLLEAVTNVSHDSVFAPGKMRLDTAASTNAPNCTDNAHSINYVALRV